MDSWLLMGILLLDNVTYMVILFVCIFLMFYEGYRNECVEIKVEVIDGP